MIVTVIHSIYTTKIVSVRIRIGSLNVEPAVHFHRA